MLRVGLTGGIACGKSHVLRGLAREGLVTLDLDAVSHALLAAGGRGVEPVVAEFGPGVVAAGGGIDRRVLGAAVFRDPTARARLNALVHPLVRAEEERFMRELGGRAAILVVDGALIVEAGAHLRFDRLIVVHCPAEVQIERLRRRDGLDAEAARQRVGAQMSVDEKRRFANEEIDTSGSPGETDGEVQALARRLEALEAGESRRVDLGHERVQACLTYGPQAGPRGLTIATVLRCALAAGRVDLAELAGLVAPGHGGVWYEIAGSSDAGQESEGLGIAAALWELTAERPDLVHCVSAAASLVRLVERDPVAIVGACLLAEALFVVGLAGRVPRDWRERLSAWREAGRKWGAVEPRAGVSSALDAAARFPADRLGARHACLVAGGSPDLVGALVGLAGGLGAEDEGAGTQDEQTARALARRG